MLLLVTVLSTVNVYQCCQLVKAPDTNWMGNPVKRAFSEY